MTTHVVQRGEYLSKIAKRYGFKSYRAIYEHPDNAEFRRLRPDPNLIFPGDKIIIPSKAEVKFVSCVTGSRHTFQVKLGKKHLKIYLRDGQGKLLRDEPFSLEISGAVTTGRTNKEGLLDEVVPDDAGRATLTVQNYRWNLLIGGLNPIENTPDQGVSGAQARLSNLGYDPGPIDGQMGPRTRSAIRCFQRDFRLQKTGTLDQPTLEKLKSRHRS